MTTDETNITSNTTSITSLNTRLTTDESIINTLNSDILALNKASFTIGSVINLSSGSNTLLDTNCGVLTMNNNKYITQVVHQKVII